MNCFNCEFAVYYFIIGVTERDVELFRKAQEKANTCINNTPAAPNPHAKYPPCIEFGRWEIETWYSSPYPQEYARYETLHLYVTIL